MPRSGAPPRTGGYESGCATIGAGGVRVEREDGEGRRLRADRGAGALDHRRQRVCLEDRLVLEVLLETGQLAPRHRRIALGRPVKALMRQPPNREAQEVII